MRLGISSGAPRRYSGCHSAGWHIEEHEIMTARAFLLAAVCGGLALTAGQGQQPKDTLRIGVSARMSEHLDADTVREGMKSLRSLVQEETGHPTEVEIEPDWK